MLNNYHVNVGNIVLGNDLPVVLIAGPCALESRDHVIDVAGQLAELCKSLQIPLIFKTSFDKANRTLSSSPRGVGLETSLPIFSEIRKSIGVPVLTDVHLPEQCEMIKDFVDVIQIPAFLCRQTDLLEAAAETKCTVNVKKGQFLSPKDMKNVISKISSMGNENILLTERGTFFGYNALVSDFRSLPSMSEFGYPVVFDATHSVQQPGGLGGKSGGERRYVEILSRAAVAVGCSALFIETHPNPDNAPSDGPNMVPLSEMKSLLEGVIEIDLLTKQK